MTDRGNPANLAAHERLRQPHVSVAERGGEKFWVKYHFKTVQGIENFTDADAKAMAAEDKGLPSARSVQVDRQRRGTGVATGDADHALPRCGGTIASILST